MVERYLFVSYEGRQYMPIKKFNPAQEFQNEDNPWPTKHKCEVTICSVVRNNSGAIVYAFVLADPDNLDKPLGFEIYVEADGSAVCSTPRPEVVEDMLSNIGLDKPDSREIVIEDPNWEYPTYVD
jgi:hypothetical protein